MPARNPPAQAVQCQRPKVEYQRQRRAQSHPLYFKTLEEKNRFRTMAIKAGYEHNFNGWLLHEASVPFQRLPDNSEPEQEQDRSKRDDKDNEGERVHGRGRREQPPGAEPVDQDEASRNQGDEEGDRSERRMCPRHEAPCFQQDTDVVPNAFGPIPISRVAVPRTVIRMSRTTDWFHDFERRFEDMRREMISRLGREPLLLPAGNGARAALADVEDAGKEFIAKVELPGLRKEDVHLEVDKRSLRVWGETKHEEETKRKGFVRHERSSTSFERYLTLPEEINPDAARAKFDNGVLEVVIPKTKPASDHGHEVKIS